MAIRNRALLGHTPALALIKHALLATGCTALVIASAPRALLGARHKRRRSAPPSTTPMGRAGGQIFLTRERCHFSRGKLGERDSATQWYVRGCPKHIRQVPTRRTPGAHIWTRDWRVRQRDPSRVMHKSQPARGPLKPHRHYSHCRLAALARSDSFPLGGSHLPPASSTFCQQIPVVPAGAPAKVHTRAGAQQAQAARHIPPRNMGAPEKGGGRAGEQCLPQLVKDHKSYARDPNALQQNPTAHKPSRTLETRCLDAQCTCRTHTAAVVSGIYPSIEEVHSGTQWLNCQRPSDPSNSGGSPNRAGGRVQQKTEKTRHCSSQAKLQTHARRKSMTVHVLVRVCGTRWPKAQPTPARPDHTKARPA